MKQKQPRIKAWLFASPASPRIEHLIFLHLYRCKNANIERKKIYEKNEENIGDLAHKDYTKYICMLSYFLKVIFSIIKQ